MVNSAQYPNVKGETAYLGGDVRNGRPDGSSLPDAVYGADLLHPEMLFDLKTGFKGIEKWWATKLSANLPEAAKGVPIFKLSC